MSGSHIIDFFIRLQLTLSPLIKVSPLDVSRVETLCGLDVSYSGEEGVAAAVLWSRVERRVVESAAFRGAVLTPYVPGLLYVREAPLMLAAIRRLSRVPDLLLIDGHGLAHPRRAGLASIVGLLADTPSIGVAKSMLYGEARLEEGVECIVVGDERVGVVFRDDRGRRFYVSLGHRVDFGSVLRIIGQLGSDLLSPLREAHRLSKNALRSGLEGRPAP
ncbi:MAG: endonuclease V [Nitrososphaerota archaeon]|nr:endonuclease V [Candidatus Calditenuaceae archaeon]MDW8073549.1 endonuclease V [Nitrososphaerota archaeon]